jgi:choline dehydrogenase-like flavoprotein
MIESLADNSTKEVYARKEVILAAGAIQTPQLLQVSGVGPRSALKAAGVKVRKNLPAVGANLQDNLLVFMMFNLTNPSFPNPNTITTNATYNASVWEEYWINKTGPIAAGSSDMAAFLSLPQISRNASSIAAEYAAQDASKYLPDAYKDRALLKGYQAQQRILARRFDSNDATVVGQALRGSGSAPNPFLKHVSRGTVTLDPKNPQGLPVVQYNTLMNPIDTKIVLAIVRNARSFWSRTELAHLGPVEIVPGAQFQTDDEILNALIDQGWLLPSLAHPSGTCAMAPEELGGCVGPDLKVYGIAGLSVVDASIMPLIPGCPLQSTVYAVAEKAADIIKARA